MAEHEEVLLNVSVKVARNDVVLLSATVAVTVKLPSAFERFVASCVPEQSGVEYNFTVMFGLAVPEMTGELLFALEAGLTPVITGGLGPELTS